MWSNFLVCWVQLTKQLQQLCVSFFMNYLRKGWYFDHHLLYVIMYRAMCTIRVNFFWVLVFILLYVSCLTVDHSLEYIVWLKMLLHQISSNSFLLHSFSKRWLVKAQVKNNFFLQKVAPWEMELNLAVSLMAVYKSLR